MQDLLQTFLFHFLFLVFLFSFPPITWTNAFSFYVLYHSVRKEQMHARAFHFFSVLVLCFFLTGSVFGSPLSQGFLFLQ